MHFTERTKIYLPFTPTGKTGSTIAEKFPKKAKIELSDKDLLLQEQLKKLRRNLAEEYNVPPYVIFGDKTLEQLVYQKPLSEFELENIYGLAEKKIQRYGESIIKIIEEYM